jgi:prepilin signal peptidase PulO-like enzyme (type II secretory pathway)
MKVLDRSACPACGKAISLGQLQGSEKYAIRCRRCDARLWKRTRAMLLVFPTTFFLWRIQVEVGHFNWTYASAALGALVMIAVVAWLTVRVELAPDDLPERPKLSEPPKFETNDEPSPLSPTFRGMSGPPPKDDA